MALLVEIVRHDTPRDEVIAAMIHEASRVYCQSMGDTSQVHWPDAPGWQRAPALEGVRSILAGAVATPEQSHEAWIAQKLADGWCYGPQKDAEAKTHPCLVPYAELPPSQRAKDALFFAVVNAMAATL
jgi:hypothetical protein